MSTSSLERHVKLTIAVASHQVLREVSTALRSKIKGKGNKSKNMLIDSAVEAKSNLLKTISLELFELWRAWLAKDAESGNGSSEGER